MPKSRGTSFVMVLVALAIVGGAFAIGNNNQAPIINNQGSLAAVISARDKSMLADIERELGFAQKSAGISPTSFRMLDKKLKALEAKGVDTKKARTILKKLSIGGTQGIIQENSNGQAKTISPTSNGSWQARSAVSELSAIEREVSGALNGGGVDPKSYQNIEIRLTKLEAKGVDTSKVRALFQNLRIGGVESRPDCVHNSRPVFTHDITDLGKVSSIFTPPNLVKGDLKTHSYIGTNHARVPVYAPVDMTLDSVSYTTVGPYGMGFEVSCEVKIGFGHITEPVPAILALMPSIQATTTLNTGKTIRESIRFKAGDLIAYTTGTSAAGNWDFGVYNLSIKNRYAQNPVYAKSWKYANAVCPFDYFTEELRAPYAKLFNIEPATGLLPDGESFCAGKEAIIQ